MNISTTKDVPQVISDRLCAVYDEDTHEVVHFHRVMTLEGGETPSDEAMCVRAIEHAKNIELKPAYDRRIAPLIVDPTEFQPGHSHKVDIAGRKLIARRVDRTD